ncbi:MAG TPA: hypothetical protein VGN16_21090 [Acidobacteriaceae bacterium]
MAPKPDVLADIEKRLASVEHGLKYARIIALGLVTAAVGCLGWLSHKIDTVEERLNKLDERISYLDGKLGNPLNATIQDLTKPKSDAALAASLSVFSGEIQKNRVEKKPPKPENIVKLADALDDVLVKHSDIPTAWQAGAELVSYRSESLVKLPETLPDCSDTLPPDGAGNIDKLEVEGTESYVPGFTNAPADTPWRTHVELGHCQLNLDDDGHFNSTRLGKYLLLVKQHHPNMVMFDIWINDARIVYSGGKMIPFTSIAYVNCQFILKPLPETPNKNGQGFTRQLLAADPQKGNVSLQSS